MSVKEKEKETFVTKEVSLETIKSSLEITTKNGEIIRLKFRAGLEPGQTILPSPSFVIENYSDGLVNDFISLIREYIKDQDKPNIMHL